MCGSGAFFYGRAIPGKMPISAMGGLSLENGVFLENRHSEDRMDQAGTGQHDGTGF